jgi:putative nucleotidyltransferase with HDIG domain
LKALGNSTSDFRKIAEIIEKDPVLTAHLLKLGNLASVSRGEETKSVTHALTRIGLDQATFHIWALCMKNLYSSPPLQSVWNHSLRTVEAMDDLCKQTRYSHTTDARLAALLHDIGHLVLFALGDEYSVARASLLDLGIYPMEIERRLCGLTHAEIGADLLLSWEFPRYMTDAIRHHHAPFQSDSVLTALLYSCECWTDSGEDVYDPLEHQHAAGLLGLNAVQFSGDRQHRADLRLLRFAA